MEYELPEDVVTLRDGAREFATRELAPHARQWDRESQLPAELIGKLGAAGFLGMHVPRDCGGVGGLLGAVSVIEELARHCGSTALVVAAHNGLCCTHLLLAGNDEQKTRLLPALARGDMLGAWALTEPAAGSDAAALKMAAVADSDAWVISGSKRFVTNGDVAGMFVIVARTDPDAPDDKGISAFVVPRDAAGLQIGPKDEKMGMRAAGTVPLSLEDVRVPKENLIGELHGGFGDVSCVLQCGRVFTAAISVGLGRGAMEESVAYAGQREQSGKRLIDHQAIQFLLADMSTELDAARLLIYKAATLLDSGADAEMESSMGNLFASEAATRACLNAIQVLGGHGCTTEAPVERYMRDAKVCEISDGSNQVQRFAIARRLLEA